MKNVPREKSIGAQMIITSLLMRKEIHKAIRKAEIDITLDQLGIIEILLNHGELNMTELSFIAYKQNANITRIVDKLEERGLLERKAVKGDRRANLISVTEVGIKLYNETKPVVTKTYKEIVSCITNEEEQTILSATQKLINHLS